MRWILGNLRDLGPVAERYEKIASHPKISRKGAKDAKQTKTFFLACLASWRENRISSPEASVTE